MSFQRKQLYVLIIAVLFFTTVWIPFLWLSFYNLPIGMHEWDWITLYGGKLSGSWWDTQLYIYRELTGRFTSNALLSITQWWCTLATFPYFFFVWQWVWFGIIYLTIRVWLKGISWTQGIFIAIGIQTLYLFQLEDVYDSIFRYSAILTYQMGAVLSMLAFICFLRCCTEVNKSKLLQFGALGFMILSIGTNEISMVLTCLVLGVIVFYKSVIVKEKITFFFLALVIAILSSLIVILAPGNEMRISAEQGGLSFAGLMGTTLGTTFYLWFDWLSSGMLLLMTILAVPLLFSKGTGLTNLSLFRDYRPWLWILVLSVPATMGILMYATGGDTFPERVIDHLFIHVIFIWIGLLISLVKKYNLSENQIAINHHRWVRTGYFICLIVAGLNVFGDGISINHKDKENSHRYLSLLQSGSNITNAWLVLLKGEAQSYHRQSKEQMDQLYSCASDNCYMRKPDVLPMQLYDPLSDRRNRNGDGYMGYYFNPKIKRVMYYTE